MPVLGTSPPSGVGRDRAVPVEGLRNLRDLGGLKAGDQLVRAGVLFRSEAPIGLGPGGLQALRDMGIRTIVDLRDENECAAEPTVIPPGISQINLPVPTLSDDHNGVPLLDRLLAGELASYSAADLGQTYVTMLERQGPAFGKVIAVLADPDRWPALVHCVAGKDRTGLACALLLSSLGVDDDEIIDDYVLTSGSRAHRIGEVTPALTELGVEPSAVESLFTAPREALEAAFTHLHERYGSADQYLRVSAGVSPELLGSLKERLLVPAPA